MFTIKFFYFLKGYVIIEVSGKSVYQLINRCIDQGIRMYNAQGGDTLRFAVSRNDFFKLARLSRETHTKVRIIKKYGLVYLLHRHRKRKLFAVGAGLFVLFFAVSTQFLWDIQVEGEDNISRQAVLDSLAEIGVKPGTPLAKLPDAMTMKEHLVTEFENVPWAWVYLDGVRATVQIHEGIVPPIMVDEDMPCDIVAARDGFIIKNSVKKGMERIPAGNAVKAGEVIISGLVETGTEDKPKSYLVHADGDVHALTRYTETKTYPLVRDHPVFSGRRKSTYEITLFSKTFNMFNAPEYDYYIMHEDLFSPKLLSKYFNFGIRRKIYEEAELEEETLPADWVIEEAKRDLSAVIGEQLSVGARLQSEDYTVTENTESITVTATMEFTEIIGTCVPIQ